MPHSQRLTFREINRQKPNPALRQVLILVLTVVIGVLVSVSVNAQHAAEKSKESGKKAENKKRTLPYKKKNRAKANFYAGADTGQAPALIEASDLSAITSLQMNFIREMVALHLSEPHTDIDLAPLVFKVNNHKLAATDINPLLIAVQFAVQGRKIVIANNRDKNDTFDLSRTQLEEIRMLMFRLGVPAERVSVNEHEGSQTPASHGISKVDFHVI